MKPTTFKQLTKEDIVYKETVSLQVGDHLSGGPEDFFEMKYTNKNGGAHFNVWEKFETSRILEEYGPTIDFTFYNIGDNTVLWGVHERRWGDDDGEEQSYIDMLSPVPGTHFKPSAEFKKQCLDFLDSQGFTKWEPEEEEVYEEEEPEEVPYW